jgi:hypothetical protein
MPRRPCMPSCLGVSACPRALAEVVNPAASVFWHAPRGAAPHAPGSSTAIGTPTQWPAQIGTDWHRCAINCELSVCDPEPNQKPSGSTTAGLPGCGRRHDGATVQWAVGGGSGQWQWHGEVGQRCQFEPQSRAVEQQFSGAGSGGSASPRRWANVEANNCEPCRATDALPGSPRLDECCWVGAPAWLTSSMAGRSCTARTAVDASATRIWSRCSASHCVRRR